jgi:hypothetical protein
VAYALFGRAGFRENCEVGLSPATSARLSVLRHVSCDAFFNLHLQHPN